MKTLKFLALVLLPMLAFAQEKSSGFYATFDTGVEYLNLQTSDKKSKVNKGNIGTIRAKAGYEWETGWRFGAVVEHAGEGVTSSNITGTPLVRGVEHLPLTYADGIFAYSLVLGLQGGYHFVRSKQRDMYVNFYYLGKADFHTQTMPLAYAIGLAEFRLELEGRELILPKWSLGYTIGASMGGGEVNIGTIDDKKYMRIGAEGDETTDLDGTIYGLYGDLKWIYHASNTTDFFIKWDMKVNFYPQSKAVRTNMYDILNNRSLGDVTLYTPKYRTFRSGISLGFAF